MAISPGFFQRLGMSLAVLQAVKDRGFLHRDIRQAHQLARLNSYPTSRQEVSMSISPVLIATVRQRFRSRCHLL
jgi:hypothetical protein